jgi:hypothetical protein
MEQAPYSQKVFKEHTERAQCSCADERGCAVDEWCLRAVKMI